MDVNEALTSLAEARNQELAQQQEALLRQQIALQQGEPDDEIDDELGIEFVDPSLGHVVHLMDLLDILNTPAPEPRPAYRP